MVVGVCKRCRGSQSSRDNGSTAATVRTCELLKSSSMSACQVKLYFDIATVAFYALGSSRWRPWLSRTRVCVEFAPFLYRLRHLLGAAPQVRRHGSVITLLTQSESSARITSPLHASGAYTCLLSRTPRSGDVTILQKIEL